MNLKIYVDSIVDKWITSVNLSPKYAKNGLNIQKFISMHANL